MNEEVMATIRWVSGGFGTIMLLMFGIISRKVNQKDFDKHCDQQAKVNEKFDDTIKKNNELLIEVKTKLHERTKNDRTK